MHVSRICRIYRIHDPNMLYHSDGEDRHAKEKANGRLGSRKAGRE